MLSKLFKSTLFERTIIKECTSSSLIVFVTLLGITLTSILIRFLGQSASGNLPSESIWVLIVLNVLNYLPILLSLTLFLAILMTVNRSYKDSEMIVWQSSGVSLLQWLRPIFIFTVPLVAIISLCSLWITPNLTEKSEIYRLQADTNDDNNFMHLGVFKESKDHKTVYFIEGITGSSNNIIKNVFVQSSIDGKHAVVFAKEASQRLNQNADLELTLMNGKRYERTSITSQNDEPNYKILTFGKYQMSITPKTGVNLDNLSTKSVSSQKLFSIFSPIAQSELTWRIGLPISALILSVFAILLGFMNPRMAKSLNLFLAVLSYMLYSNLISIMQGLVNKQLFSLWSGLIFLHGSMLVLVIFFFAYRAYGFQYFKFKYKKL